MDSDKWEQAKRLYEAALKCSPDERARFLDENCEGDEELRREVESLLSFSDNAGSFLEKEAVGEVAEIIAARNENLTSGQSLSHYKIVGPIGAGGMGEVYLAEDTSLNRKVAVKFLSPELGFDDRHLQRFVREARAASALNHPNICTIYEIGSAGDAPFMAMEYVEGETLERKIKSGKLELSAALEIAVQIADALSEAHAHGIIHRDIKPSNIIVNRRSQVKILDFGLAKKIAAESEAETWQLVSQEGMILGTAAYMSPEQARGRETDARSDIFSFGIVLYEMLTGRRAFAGENALDVIGAILHTEPVPLKQILPEIPLEIERIVSKTLEKDRAGRYQTAKELLADLKELKEELSFRAKLERGAPTRHAEAETKIIRAAATAETNSIAILPFANMSADEENEYFCDGLAEELSNALAKIEDLRVAARTSSFSFKNKNVEVGEIGKTLNVKTILEGSVRKSGDKLRIMVQLINAADGYHLWSERYDREMRDIFDVQDEIAMAVVDALKLKLLGEEKAGLLKRYTDNAEAYQLFLKGRYHWYQQTAENVRKSRAYFEQAIELDPAYAPGYAGLGEYYGFSAAVGMMPPDEGWRKAEELLTKAQELDDTLPEVHNGLAAINIFYYRDWDRAEREVRRVIELNQNFAEVHSLYSIYLVGIGRLDDAITEARRALELDPFSANYHRYLGNWLYYARRYEETIREYLEAIELGAHNAPLYEDLGNAYEQNRMTGEAVAAWRQAMILSGEDELAATLDESYAKGDFRSAVQAVARKKLSLLGERRESGTYVPANEFARLYARLGDKEQALEWLEKAFEERNGFALFINVDPVYNSLRFDSRYRDFLRRSGLSFDENRKGESVGEPGEARAVPASAATGAGENPVNAIKVSAPTASPTDKPKIKRSRLMIALLGLVALAVGFFAYRSLTPDGKQIESIAVMPFVNESGDSEAEYLSDGMTETLINNLSQLPNLSVKARSSVFHYKGKAVSPQTVGAELSVQAVLNGRVIQRGDNLTLSLELVDTQTGNQIWGEQYSRKQSDLVFLQTEIARDVSQKLKIKLSGADMERLAKNYTENNEAYQLYLRGRFHVLKATRSELQKGISYFEQAIGVDPAYALAYAGLADAYRALSLAGELAPHEHMPKAKAAARKAIEIDDRLADAHTALGFIIFLYDYDWNAAENQFKRALELEPNNADAHLFYAHLLSNMGRSAEALAEAKRARELDPLNLRTGALEAQFLIHAGQTDEALFRLQKTLELNQNYWLPHHFLASAYIEKGMYAEAIAEARRAGELNRIGITPPAFLGYALAKSGKQAEARRVLNDLLRLSNEQYVSPYSIGLIYNGLDEPDQTMIWLERGIEERDPRVTFLKVEPKWRNLRGDPRYQDLLRRMGLPH